MGDVLYYVVILACLITAGVLILGVGGFGTGKITPRGQNKLMRMRIIAQFVAVVLIMLTVTLLKGD